MLNEQAIQDKLGKASAIIQREKGQLFLLRVLQWLPALMICLLLLDLVLQLAPWLRLVDLAGLIALALLCIIIGLLVIPFRRIPLMRTARILEEREDDLGTKPINLLQLGKQLGEWPEDSLTRDLAERAILGYLEQLSEVDMLRIARTRRVRAQLKRSTIILLCSITVIVLGGQISRMQLKRLLDPWGDHPPFTLTRLEILEPGPEGTAVIYGRDQLVRAKYHGHRPRNLFLTFHEEGHPERKTTIPLYQRSEKEFSQHIDNILTPLKVYVHTRSERSKSPKRRVNLVLTPQLEAASVRIKPPDYTQDPIRERPLRFKTLRALKGSRMTFSLVSNRPLSGGFVEMLQTGADPLRIPMKPSAEKTVACTITAERSGRLRFGMMDETGIMSTKEWETALSVTHDLPPSVRLLSPGAQAIASLNYDLTVNVQAADDYGLSSIRLHCATNGHYGEPISWQWPNKTIEKSFGVEHSLSLRDLDLWSGDILTFYAEAIDIAPTANVSRSTMVRVALVNEEEYNDLLRRQMDMKDTLDKYQELVNRFQEQIAQQQTLQAQVEQLQKELERSGGDKTRTEALEQRFRKLQAKQQEINRNLGKLADQMDSFVRVNPIYDVESEFGKTLKNFAERVRQSTAANQDSLKDLPNKVPGSSMPSLSPENLAAMKEAAEQQLKKLGAVKKKADDEVIVPLEHLAKLHELIKDFNQFKVLYVEQQDLADQLAAYREKEVLLREDQLAMKALAGKEREIGGKLGVLSTKLNDHADEAEPLFPQAAAGGRELADAIDEMRLVSRCNRATGSMLSGRGPASYQLAEEIRKDMESLFSGTCRSGGERAQQDLDRFLRLMLNAPPGRNFEQMSKSLKYNWGSGSGTGMGVSGSGGESGYSIQTGPTTQLLGGESSAKPSQATGRPGDRGTGDGQNDVVPVNEYDDPDVVPVDMTRESDSEATAGEMSVEKYKEVIEKYFEKVTSE